MTETRFQMKVVTQRTGLSAHVLRVWERRYEAVVPDRSGSNQRLYSAGELHRLELLAVLTRAGHGISQIAKSEIDELETMAAELTVSPAATPAVDRVDPSFAADLQLKIDALFSTAWAAVVSLDGTALGQTFELATREVGGSAMIEKLIVPLITEIGERWDRGEISVAQERAASKVIQEMLLLAGRPHSETRGAPNLIVATPTGQLHELGAALVVCQARRRGWSVTYLGASIPAAEIAHAASVRNSAAIALSIVYPIDDAGLPAELKQLRRLLAESCDIIVGGRASAAYRAAFDEIGAQSFSELTELKSWLDEARSNR